MTQDSIASPKPPPKVPCEMKPFAPDPSSSSRAYLGEQDSEGGDAKGKSSQREEAEDKSPREKIPMVKRPKEKIPNEQRPDERTERERANHTTRKSRKRQPESIIHRIR